MCWPRAKRWGQSLDVLNCMCDYHINALQMPGVLDDIALIQACFSGFSLPRGASDPVAPPCIRQCCERFGADYDSQLMTERVALITGITGQDGAYLAALLLQKGYVNDAPPLSTPATSTTFTKPHDRNVRLCLRLISVDGARHARTCISNLYFRLPWLLVRSSPLPSPNTLEMKPIARTVSIAIAVRKR
jgi:hypothetical protein